MQFRLATLADAPALCRLRWLHAIEEQPRKEQDRIAFEQRFCVFLQDYLGNGYCCFVAEEAGEIVANIYLYLLPRVPLPAEEPEQIGYITKVHTLAQYRNQGLGSRLMERVRSYAKEQGCSLLFVWPSKRAVPFYRRNGFGDTELLEGLL